MVHSRVCKSLRAFAANARDGVRTCERAGFGAKLASVLEPIVRFNHGKATPSVYTAQQSEDCTEAVMRTGN